MDTVADLIKRAHGPEAIAAASKESRKPVTSDAVHKWRRNGIPDEHWWIFIKAGIDLETIYCANEAARSLKIAA
jgi:hypothetical protein